MRELGMCGFLVGTHVGDGVPTFSLPKNLETVNMAIEFTFNVPFDGVHTPTTCLLRAVSDAPDKDWNHEERVERVGIWTISALATLQCRWRCNCGCVKRKQKDSGTSVSTMCSGSIPD